MTDRVLQWGIISTARINRALIPPLRISQRNQLRAVASRSEEKARQYAQEWEIPCAYGSYEELLADPEIDVVYIPLPNAMHREWTVKAAQAGKHVLCEKPLAVTVEEVDAIRQAAEENGVVVAEAFMYRHHPQTLKVKELIDSGAIGRLQNIHGSFNFLLNRPGDVRLSAELVGGSLWDIGCYPVSYARTMTGAEPEEVYGWQEIGPSGVDVRFAGQMRFSDGVIAQFDCGFTAPLRAYMHISGSDGNIFIPAPFKPGADSRIKLQRGDEVETITFPEQELYLGEVEDLASAVLDGTEPRISLADSRSNTEVILRLLDSARTGLPR